MPNWISLTEEHLLAIAPESLIEGARGLQPGASDPVTEALADATARVRRAISAANVMDADPTKVPRSLKDLTARMALFALMERVNYELTEDQRTTRKADLSDLHRTQDQRIRVELPDVPAAAGEMQEPGVAIEAVGVVPRLTGRERTNGL